MNAALTGMRGGGRERRWHRNLPSRMPMKAWTKAPRFWQTEEGCLPQEGGKGKIGLLCRRLLTAVTKVLFSEVYLANVKSFQASGRL